MDSPPPSGNWADFKLFGMPGLTPAFVIAQAFYLAHHLNELES